jgi:hypothetical protein
MSESINPQLQSHLNISSKDKFVMLLDLPPVLKKDPTFDDTIEPLQISLFGAVVPDISVPESDVKFQGQNFHLSTYARPNYPPLVVNFVVDNSYRNYYVLWRWLNIMNLALEDYYGGSPKPFDSVYNLMLGSNFEYQANFSIIACNEYNSPVLQFKYSKAFISRLGGIQYSYRDGAVLEASADFHFSQLDVERIKNQNI